MLRSHIFKSITATNTSNTSFKCFKNRFDQLEYNFGVESKIGTKMGIYCFCITLCTLCNALYILFLIYVYYSNMRNGRLRWPSFRTCSDKQTDFYHGVWTFLSKQTNGQIFGHFWANKQTNGQKLELHKF